MARIGAALTEGAGGFGVLAGGGFQLGHLVAGDENPHDSKGNAGNRDEICFHDLTFPVPDIASPARSTKGFQQIGILFELIFRPSIAAARPGQLGPGQQQDQRGQKRPDGGAVLADR